VPCESVLHVAPEACTQSWLQPRATSYVSVDLYNPAAMHQMDLCKLTFDDNTFSSIWCSHVFEHIETDDVAIAELFRVCRPGGTAVVQVPIWRVETYEDFSITAEEDRLREFYQRDHVRLYGLDIVDRFENAGFSGSIVRAQDFGPVMLTSESLSFASTNEVFLFKRLSEG
jgi:predicted SAM-dependent methyltransferase